MGVSLELGEKEIDGSDDGSKFDVKERPKK